MACGPKATRGCAGKPITPARYFTVTCAMGPRCASGRRPSRSGSTRYSTTRRGTWWRSKPTTPNARTTCSGCFWARCVGYGASDALYLDNGATYRGDALRIACERLGITLLHARPYDAPARGKMERFWRTLREGCLDHLGTMTQLHDVQARLLAFLDEHYHQAPHGGLFGKSPATVWASATTRPVDEATLSAALTTHTRRRVRRDGTLDIDGKTWQLDQSFLAGALVMVAVDMTGTAAPVVEHDRRRYVLCPVDPIAAGRTRRTRPAAKPEATVPFDPAGALLDRVVGRPPRHRSPEED